MLRYLIQIKEEKDPEKFAPIANKAQGWSIVRFTEVLFHKF